MVNGELTPMRTVYLIVALLVVSGSAQAWEIRSSCAFSRYYGSSSCRTIGTPDQPPPPRDYAQEAEDLKAKEARIRKWEAFCQPVRTYDNVGVARLVYAQRGCEFGRTE
jgi:hypothetical protein